MSEQQQAGDPYAQRHGPRTSPRKGFWYAGPTYMAPGVYYSRQRILIVSEWLTRPRYKWHVRGYGRRWV